MPPTTGRFFYVDYGGYRNVHSINLKVEHKRTEDEELHRQKGVMDGYKMSLST